MRERIVTHITIAVKALRITSIWHDAIRRSEAACQWVVVAGVVVQQTAPVLDLSRVVYISLSDCAIDTATEIAPGCLL